MPSGVFKEALRCPTVAAGSGFDPKDQSSQLLLLTGKISVTEEEIVLRMEGTVKIPYRMDGNGVCLLQLP